MLTAIRPSVNSSSYAQPVAYSSYRQPDYTIQLLLPIACKLLTVKFYLNKTNSSILESCKY